MDVRVQGHIVIPFDTVVRVRDVRDINVLRVKDIPRRDRYEARVEVETMAEEVKRDARHQAR